jgi:hypothetical protein
LEKQLLSLSKEVEAWNLKNPSLKPACCHSQLPLRAPKRYTFKDPGHSTRGSLFKASVSRRCPDCGELLHQ